MLVGRELCWQYLGVVLDETSRQLLLSTYRPQFSDVRCHHVTLLHNNDCHFSALESMLCSHPLGSECTVTVYGEISDFQCHGAVVEITDDAEQQFASSGVHHLTISHDASVTPKYTASLLSQKQSSGAKYNIRSEPLLLRGVVSLCMRTNGRSAPSSTYCLKHISDFLRVMASAGTQTIHSENNASIKINKLRYSRQLSQYSFHAIHSGIKRVLIFDFDDTLIYTPSTHDYLAVRKKAWHKPDASRGAGWYCSEDSLSCDLPMRAGPALNTLLDSAGGSSTCIIVLTGRHEGLSHLVKEVLAARGVLNHIDEVVCKPQRGQCTANFKADYVGALLECCPWVEAVSVWDDKIENLSKIKEAFNSHQRLYLGISLPVLETSLIQLDEPATVFASGVEAWAESNGQMASKEHKIRTQFVIDEISYIWNAVLGEYINTSNFKSAYTFGSYDFERRSDLDILLVCPIILEFSRDCNWMKTLVGCLNNSSCHIEKQFYFGDSGNVPRMAARYIWSEGPSIDVDIIMLYCVNQELLVDGIDLKLAMSWSLKDMALMSSSIDLLPLATRKSLYGIAVKNTCLQCCEKYRIARRQFGCLISAARRVMDRCHCMGSSRTGMRPYLISLSMVAAIDIMASTISLDEILALWLRMHTKDCVGIPDAIAHLRQFYPVGTIPDCNLLRIHDSIQSLDKDFTNIMAKLNTIGLPSPWNYRTVRIRTSQKLDKCSSFVVENVIHGIISKYSARLTHSGYPVLSAAPDGVQCIEERKEKCVGHLGVSKYGVDAAEGLFPLIVRDFDNFMKSAAACKTLRKKISLALDLV